MVSMYISAGTFTLYNSIDGNNWKMVKDDISGDDNIHIAGFTPNEFFKIEENNGAEFTGNVNGATQLI